MSDAVSAESVSTGDNVIPFPVRPRQAAAQPVDPFEDWMNWAESELAILGYDLSATTYNWRAAHQKGLRPETAASHAVRGLQAG